MGYRDIPLAELGSRMADARRRSGLTQQALAERIGVSRPTIITTEKGKRRPRPEELIKIAEAIEIPVTELVRSGSARPRVEPHFRIGLAGSDKQVAAARDAVAELERFAEDYAELEHLADGKPFDEYPPRVQLRRGAQTALAENWAQRERSRLGLGDRPVFGLRQLLEDSAGLRIAFLAIDSMIAGLYAFVEDLGYCVVINRKHPPARRRWTIAHEYGHFLVDRDQPGLDWSRPLKRRPPNELFADAFAASFLMPASGIERHYFDLVDRTGDFQVGDICRLAEIYLVSFQAMSLRLEALGLIAQGTWDELARDGFKPVEANQLVGIVPGDDFDSADTMPARYRLLAVKLYLGGDLTEGQLARFLRCDRVEARDRVAAMSSLQISDDSDEVDTVRQLQLPLQRSVAVGIHE